MPLPKPPETHKPDKPLLPKWAAVALVVAALLASSAYFSADMRAVFVAAWAACF